MKIVFGMARKCINPEVPISLAGYFNRRMWDHVLDDIEVRALVLKDAKGHVAALKYSETHKGAEAINLGTGRGYSVMDLINAFERVNGVKINYVNMPRRPGDVAINYADPQKAEKLLGWKAALGLDDMVRDAWNWQRNNPKGY